MSVLPLNSQNRLLKSTSIRTGKSAARYGQASSYGDNSGGRPLTVTSFVLRIMAIFGLFFAIHFLFRVETATLTAMPIDAASAAQFSVQGGSGTVARSNGLIEPVAADSVGNVIEGDMIVADDGTVLLSFPDGQSVILEPGSSITIEQLETVNEIQRVQLVVWSGRVQYTTDVENQVEDYFYVSSTSSSSRIDAGSMSLDVIDPQKTRYAVLDGTATIEMGGQTVQLQASQYLNASLGDLLTAELDAVVMDPRDAVNEKHVIDVTSMRIEASSTIEIAETDALTYEVQNGDTMWSIAIQYGINMDSIVRANPLITDSSFLYIGQQLFIPTDMAISTEIGTN